MCDCSWASTSGACSGGGDGTECWYACCRVPATPSNGFTVPSNPFKHNAFYVNPTYRQHIRSTKEHSDDPVIQAALESLINVPSAYWLDTKERLTGAAGSTDNLEGILADATSFPTPPLCVFIVYDLPNRDCKALASNGEICCTYHADGTCDYETAGDCQRGLAEYKSEYIDPMRAILERYTKVPVVLIVEPDSLPNLVTNQADARCGNPATNRAYREGVKYAVNTLSSVSSVSLYLDAAHGGWLGWPVQAGKFARLVAELGVHTSIRGYSTNVANYQPLGSACPPENFPLHQHCRQDQGEAPPCCRDACKLIESTSDGNNELNYVQMLANHLRAAGVATPHFVIDTGRNGVDDMRADCSNWCNIRGAGLGLWPTADTALPELVDAYFWLKTPGESDGCTSHLADGSTCSRYDGFCGSADSLGSRAGEPRAPEAGQWFTEQVLQLASHEHIRAQTRVALGLVRPPRPPPHAQSMAPMHATTLRSPPPPVAAQQSLPSANGNASVPVLLLVLLLLTVLVLAILVLWLLCCRGWCRRFRGLKLLPGDGSDLGPDTPGLCAATESLESAELAVAQAELRVKRAELAAARARIAAQQESTDAAAASAREQASMEAEILD